MWLNKLLKHTSLIGLVALLTACISGGPANTRVNATPLASVAAVPAVAARQAEPAVSAKAVADMRALASVRGQQLYRIGPSDLLDIKVFQASELSREVRVDQRGNITLPLLGTIRAAGLSQGEMEKRLADLLGRNLLQNPQVSVFIKEFTSQRVTVEGEVNNQGVFPLSGDVSVIQAVALAGGLREEADPANVTLFRKQGAGVRPYALDLNAIRNGLVSDPYLQNDDRIVVQKRPIVRVTVEGQVNRPGVYPYKDRITVMQAIALAGGISNLGRPDSIAVFRREADGERIYSVNLNDIRSGKSPDPFVQQDDRIVVDRSNSRYWLREIGPLLSPLGLISGWLN